MIHETDRVTDYDAGFLTCTATEAVTRARAAYAADPIGQLERNATAKGAADPNAWRLWLHWPASTEGPTFEPLD